MLHGVPEVGQKYCSAISAPALRKKPHKQNPPHIHTGPRARARAHARFAIPTRLYSNPGTVLKHCDNPDAALLDGA